MSSTSKSVWTLKVAAAPQSVDREELLRALRHLVDPDACHEARSVPSGRSAPVRGAALTASLDAIEGIADGSGTYLTLNPVRDDLVGAARVGDVTRRRHLLIDVDPVRPTNSNASEIEKHEAELVIGTVAADLEKRGWPGPLVIDSGNGWHLVYRVDLPNDKPAQQLLGKALKALAAAHDTAGATVDVKVHNASRITKLPGTWARKGPHSPDRPHRQARLVSVPTAFTAVPAERIEELAGLAPTLPARVVDPWVMPVRAAGQSHNGYARQALEGECREIEAGREGDRNNRLNLGAFRIGQLLHLGLDRGQAERALIEAGASAGLGEAELRATVRSGLDAGALEPRQPNERPEADGKAPAKGAGKGTTPAAKVEVDGLPNCDEVVTVKLSTVQSVPIEWLMPGRIPLGKITLLAGLAKQGKSFFTMDLAARVSSGDEIPGARGECFTPSPVVLLSAEDDLDDTVKPRLEKAGADTELIEALTTLRAPDGSFYPFSLSHVPHLERAVVRTGARLVIIDPVTHYIGGKIDDNKVSALRALLGPVKELASRRKVAILIVTHLNKSGGANALNRVIGSSAYTALARANWLICRDPKDPKRRLLLDAGTNISEDPKGLAYRIVDGRLEWEDGEIDMTADQALAVEAEDAKEGRAKDRGPNRAAKAVEWLRTIFEGQTEIPSDEIFNKGAEKDHHRNALYEAKDVIGIKPFKKNGRWHWRLPDPTPDTADPPFD